MSQINYWRHQRNSQPSSCKPCIETWTPPINMFKTNLQWKISKQIVIPSETCLKYFVFNSPLHNYDSLSFRNIDIINAISGCLQHKAEWTNVYEPDCGSRSQHKNKNSFPFFFKKIFCLKSLKLLIKLSQTYGMYIL